MPPKKKLKYKNAEEALEYMDTLPDVSCSELNSDTAEETDTVGEKTECVKEQRLIKKVLQKRIDRKRKNANLQEKHMENSDSSPYEFSDNEMESPQRITVLRKQVIADSSDEEVFFNTFKTPAKIKKTKSLAAAAAVSPLAQPLYRPASPVAGPSFPTLRVPASPVAGPSFPTLRVPASPVAGPSTEVPRPRSSTPKQGLNTPPHSQEGDTDIDIETEDESDQDVLDSGDEADNESAGTGDEADEETDEETDAQPEPLQPPRQLKNYDGDRVVKDDVTNGWLDPLEHTTDQYPSVIPVFSEDNPGELLFETEGMKPIDYFYRMFPEFLFVDIAQETNRYHASGATNRKFSKYNKFLSSFIHFWQTRKYQSRIFGKHETSINPQQTTNLRPHIDATWPTSISDIFGTQLYCKQFY